MVSLKHKVTIKTKIAQEETHVADSKHVTIIRKKPEVQETPVNSTGSSIPPTPHNPSTPTREPKGSSKAWIWILVVVIAAIIAFFCFKNRGNKEDGTVDEETGVPQTEQVDSTAKKESPESTVGEKATNDGQESTDNAGSYNASEASDAPAEPKAETNVGHKVAPAAKVPETNGATASVKQEKKQTSSSPASNPTEQVSGNLEEKARQVIRGAFGNGQERKDKLGSAYSEIQGRVNEMYRQGLVH